MKWGRRYRARLRRTLRAALGAWHNDYWTVQLTTDGVERTFINCIPYDEKPDWAALERLQRAQQA